MIVQRPCDPDDVYVAAISLKRKGKLRNRHLAVLGKYGLKERSPDPRYREEEEAFRLWSEAIDRLSTILSEKGIVESD